MANLKDIAFEAGVSIRTASVVLRGKGPESRISMVQQKRIREIAERLHYRPDAAARAMRTHRTGIVALLLQPALGTGHVPNAGASSLAFEASLFLNDAGYSACFLPVADVLADAGERSAIFQEKMVDGLMVINSAPGHLRSRIAQISPNTVWVDHNHFESFCCIRRDEVHAGELVITELHKLGYRRFLYLELEHLRGHYSEAGRWDGVKRAAESLGVTIESLDCSYERLISEPPDRLRRLEPGWALVTYDGRLALEVIGYFGRLGKRVGIDFALASCDASVELGGPFRAVARVAFDRVRMARQAAQMLLNVMGGDRHAAPSVELRDHWHGGDSAPLAP